MEGLGGGFVNLPNSKAGEAGLALERTVEGATEMTPPAVTPLHCSRERKTCLPQTQTKIEGWCWGISESCPVIHGWGQQLPAQEPQNNPITFLMCGHSPRTKLGCNRMGSERWCQLRSHSGISV